MDGSSQVLFTVVDFFREILPSNKKLPPKLDVRKKKLDDCTTVAFQITRLMRPKKGNTPTYLIPVESLKLIYGELT